MKLISVRSVFVLILIWTIGVVFYMTSKYLCCLFNSQLFLKYRESSKAGQKSQYQFFDNEENYVDDSLNYQCNSTMVTHKTAKLSVTKTCSRHPMLTSTLHQLSKKQQEILLSHLIVNDKYKFIYCYTPKVACSNWKKIIKQLYGNLKNEEWNHLDHRSGYTFLSQYSPEEIKKKLKTYYKFMFVRNPTERALSVYRNKFNEIEEFYKIYGPKINFLYHSNVSEENYRGKIAGDDIKFQDFIKYLATGVSAENMNEHYMPLTTLCQPCVVNYDFIGVHHNLVPDSEIVLKTIKAPSDVHFPTRQAWYKPTTDNFLQYYFSLIPSSLLKQFVNKFSLDYTLFSFPKPRFISTDFYHSDKMFCFR